MDSPHAPAYALARRGSPLREAITAAYRGAEPDAVGRLLPAATFDEAALARIRARAGALVARVRAERSGASGVDALMSEFDLSSEEGIALMCLAEALLRIPDAPTADRLIRDKLSRGDWRSHVGGSESLFVNAACWGLVVSGKLARAEANPRGLDGALTAILGRVGEPVIRAATRAAMGFLGSQFVLGETIGDALARARTKEERGYRYSFDMLGEASMTMADADRYLRTYREAIDAVGRSSAGRGIYAGPGVSVKLSALHPRYSRAQRERAMTELLPRLKELMALARSHDIGLTIDAEEADRLELSLDLLEALALDPGLAGWDGLGFVIQTVQKRGPAVVDWVLDLARRSRRRLMVRLVKGAYWDAEVKRAQVAGHADYPVFTRKSHTDVAYLACAAKLLAEPALVFPQFATHNASTLCEVIELAGAHRDFEFQCLHGMGETLYDQVVDSADMGLPCRIYAPVGTHETLLAYLVRRLLENGANSSFVNQIVDPGVPLERLLEDPVTTAKPFAGSPHPRVPAPPSLYPDRANSRGIDLTDEHALADLEASLDAAARESWTAHPMLGAAGAAAGASRAVPVPNPADPRQVVGESTDATMEDVDRALAFACDSDVWPTTEPAERADLLEKCADLLEENAPRLIHLAVREAGKTLPNAVGEVREAVDFCRYYALRLRQEALPPPLGVVACISPWNFPLAIFVGQVAAALAAGNAVVAKPAEQTPLIAAEAVRLFREAGVPAPALQLLPGPGETVGARLVADPRVDGVVFTGSTEVAEIIHRTLAARGNVPLIAETGGQNAMIVDSSALPEQVVSDALSSAFDSAGQRCSALRVLVLQDEIAGHVLEMLAGAMRELAVGDPARLATDVGPIIDAGAKAGLDAHVARLEKSAKLIARAPLPAGLAGHFVAPVAFEIGAIRELEREVFGPVLHVVRFRGGELARVVDEVNATGYGLTLGIHSRLDSTIDLVVNRARAGNIYVNRNVVGAVVGVQPFGGEGKSGTGPKAGGPLTLRALARERGKESAAPDIPLPPEAEAPAPDFAAAVDALLAAAPKAATVDRAAVLDAIAAHGGEFLAELARDYRAAMDEGRERELPGPTGERNTWRAHPRGLTVAIGDEGDRPLTWLAQAMAAVAAGNPVLLAPAGDSATAGRIVAWLRAAGWPAIAAARATRERWSTHAQLAAVIAGSAAMAASVAPALAARPGARIPVIEPGRTPRHYAVWRLQAERTVSV
ncbi:MAG: bifunctional proline dehydrogenase/L-glutamate gamma-semialdehyde dehydrogenase PutA, partial [Betaproteobacteria bacterium]|nr:bifunctional proline dehydrogenase/L-glutamate gamma-semialdehyde dehydrogenase PutA [Betaproteobacteria bacterium]